MFKRIKNIISKPSLVFMYIKDKKGQVITHLLFMSLILTLPFLMMTIIAPENTFFEEEVLTQAYNSHINNKNLEIIDGKLEKPDETYGFFIENYLFVVGDKYKSNGGYVVKFADESILIKYEMFDLINVTINEYTYEDLGMDNFKLDYTNSKKMSFITNQILAQQKSIKIANLVVEFLGSIISYLMLALILALFAKMSNRMPLKFSTHYKIAIYITTVWAISFFILTLYGYANLDFIALIILYIYHFRAYNSVKLVKKVEVKKKDEE